MPAAPVRRSADWEQWMGRREPWLAHSEPPPAGWELRLEIDLPTRRQQPVAPMAMQARPVAARRERARWEPLLARWELGLEIELPTRCQRLAGQKPTVAVRGESGARQRTEREW